MVSFWPADRGTLAPPKKTFTFVFSRSPKNQAVSNYLCLEKYGAIRWWFIVAVVVVVSVFCFAVVVVLCLACVCLF